MKKIIKILWNKRTIHEMKYVWYSFIAMIVFLIGLVVFFVGPSFVMTSIF